MFFKAFRENFKPATKLWLILLAVGSFLAADGFVLRRMWSENIFWTLLTATLIGAAVLYGIVLLYAFPLLARFENTTFGILKTAFLVGVRYLFCTLLMAAIYGIMGYVIVFVFTPAFLLGMGLCAMLCSFLMLRILYLMTSACFTMSESAMPFHSCRCTLITNRRRPPDLMMRFCMCMIHLWYTSHSPCSGTGCAGSGRIPRCRWAGGSDERRSWSC